MSKRVGFKSAKGNLPHSADHNELTIAPESEKSCELSCCLQLHKYLFIKSTFVGVHWALMPFTCHITLGKLVNCPVPQYFHL